MWSAECGISVEGRACDRTSLAIPHSALRTPHSVAYDAGRARGGPSGSLRPLAHPPYLPLPHPLPAPVSRSEEHTSELQSQSNLVCRLLLEKKKLTTRSPHVRYRPR